MIEMADNPLSDAIRAIIDESELNRRYIQRLDALISEALKGIYSDEDIKEVIQLVPHDISFSEENDED